MEGDDLPADLWSFSYHDNFPGEEAAADDNSSLLGRYSADDLFELVWQGGGGGGTTGQPVIARLRSSPSPLRAIQPPPPQSERILVDQPPFEDVMAAWLYPIVSGQDHDADCLTTKEASEVIGSSGTIMTERKGKLLATDGMSGSKTISCNMDSDYMQPIASMNNHEGANTRRDYSSEKKASGGSSSRKGSSHNSETHSTAEKRRRCKITDRLRTLQQLVPGCDDKSNQASTLDQTIQYMKSLQNHVQAMSMMPAIPSSVAAAGYPILQTPAASVVMPIPMPPATVDPGTTVAAGGHVIPPAGMAPMVPFGAMLPYRHYYSMMRPAAAAMAGPLYRPGPDVSTDAAGECRDSPQCSVLMEQWQHKER